ncbi:MAG: Bax inhibitor-1/YccA family protein [Flavobacteriales bacterium]|jgi:FtsH-binding integral membrane protein|nr:Bax inhibitor-1/YccA family protein [Flavobacteriales bacterium]
MEIKTNNYTLSKSRTTTNTFVANVFSLMFTALIISGLSAVWFATDGMKSYVINVEGGLTTLGWVSMLSPIGLVMLIGFGFQKYSAKFLLGIFLLYSTLTGISLSTIFSIYTSSSIASTFFISSLTFGVMALTGYTTKTDLTKWGSLLFMGVIGIVIASIINMFLGSSLMHYLISIVGVLVFTGLTAYDVQKIKNIGSQIDEGSQTAQKLMIMGALTLYLDFINLFLMMLRLFGNRN